MQNKKKKLSTTDNWENYEDLLPINSVEKVLTIKLIDKKFNKSIHNSTIINKNECLICYVGVEKSVSKVTCKLCSNVFHYECYKKFIENNNNYKSKCCHCGTKTLQFDIKNWWNCCW